MADGKKRKSIAKTRTEQSKVQRVSALSQDEPTEPVIPYERAIFRGSSRFDDHNVRAAFHLLGDGRDIETIEPVERIRDVKPGTECRLIRRSSTVQELLDNYPVPWPSSYLPAADFDKNQLETESASFLRKGRVVGNGPEIGVFRRLSGEVVAAIVPQDKLNVLLPGDACTFMFCKELPSGHLRFKVENEDCFLDSRTLFLPNRTLQGTVEAGEIPASLLKEIPSEAASKQVAAIPSAEEILSDISAVQEPIIRKLNAWLSSFEGKTFSPEDAPAIIAEIRHVVACAGCVLLYQGQPVSITTSAAARSKAAQLRLFTLGVSPKEQVYHKTTFPAVESRSLIDSTDSSEGA